MRQIDGHGNFVAPWTCYLGSSPAGSTTTTTSSQPWSGEQWSLENIYNQAANLDGTAVPQYYPGQTYAPITDQQTNLMNQAVNTAQNGGDEALIGADNNLLDATSPNYINTESGFNTGNNTLTALENGTLSTSATPTYNQANSVLGNELSSSYLNPWNSSSFGDVVNNTLASVIPQTSASFINGGRSDSGLATAAQTAAATNAVGNLAQSQYNTNQNIQNSAAGLASQNNQNAATNALNAAGIGTNNYLTQQGNQLKADTIAPLVDAQQSADLNAGLTAAGAAQTNSQNLINAAMSEWNYNQMQPWNQLGLYANAVEGTGNPGSEGSTSEPYFSNTLGNVTSAATGLGSLGLLGALAFA